MAENPNTWTQLEKDIFNIIVQDNKDLELGMFGLSLPRKIVDHLRKIGLVKDIKENKIELIGKDNGGS